MRMPHQLEDDLAQQFLTSRIDYERTGVPYDARDFRLDRMRDLLARLGNPHQALRIVHIAGTKGKGSTAAMIAGMLCAAGYRTGLYTSPHLARVEERLMIDGAICPTGEFGELVGRIQPIVAEMDAEGPREERGSNRPTYFEIVTALALLRFALHRVDAAVLEVGMGGRLDSTNVCHPLVSVITSISLDHTEQLGTTLAEIAREKAGIIKPGVPLVSGVLDHQPREAIAEVAQRLNCPLVELGRDFNFDYRPPRNLERSASLATMDFVHCTGQTPRKIDEVRLALIGRHQAANAAVGMAAIGELGRHGFGVSESAVRQGLADVRWPARVEVLRRAPAVVVDAAHNVASVEALARVLDESFAAPRRLLVFATTRDKNVRGMLAVLLPRFDEVIFTRYWTNPRGVPPEELEATAAGLSPIPRHACTDPATAWKLAQKLATPEHLISIAGSIFIAAEMRAVIGRVE
ncbi:MAG: bifunctional folylpolyglutamate synthase/dihydrofolate synthase [Planctomycetes bacterium]|nr:bifunctional folylpolyglutamate synthase/dihydrofolate synthase [Planctomycetota bacterium]